MSPEEVASHYREMIDEVGEMITLRRYYGTGDNRSWFDADVKARVTGYDPEALAGSMLQGDRRVVLMYEDVIAKQFPTPLSSGDWIIYDGRELAVVMPDGSTRRVQGVTIAYDLIARGA